MEIKALAQYEQALIFRARRNEILSSNIANADTPNYKARDLDFGAALRSVRGDTLSMRKTSELHQDTWAPSRHNARTMYRIPMQAALDGNTVETDVEQAAFAENALHYRATLAFMDGKIRTLQFAIKGSD